MASNGITSAWRDPALRDFAVQSIKQGQTYSQISDGIADKYGITFAPEAIKKYLAYRGLKFSMFAPGAAGIPRNLIEPKDGYATNVRMPKVQHPKGWEPHVETNGSKATAVVALEEPNADRVKIIEGYKLDPTRWRIVDGRLQCRRWDATTPVVENSTDCRCDPKQAVFHHEARTLYYYKAELEEVDPAAEAVVSELQAEIRDWKPVKPLPPTGENAYVVNLADTQIGKVDGDGSRGIVRRVLAGIASVVTRAKELRKSGVQLGPLYVFGLGDLVEGCSQNYATQTFTVELTRRQQVTVMRRLIMKALEEWAPLFEQVVVACVGGNHGEHRMDGRAFTDASDNDDVAIFEQVEDIFSVNPAAFGHMNFRIPHKELSMTLDVCGTVTCITHGHLGGRGKTASLKAHDWWMQQAHGMRAPGDAQLLITAHYHHLALRQEGAKTHLMVPALDGGSEWWTNMSGQHSTPGMVSLVVGGAVSPSGWDHLRVHSETQKTFIRSPEAKAETLRALEQAIDAYSGKDLAIAA